MLKRSTTFSTWLSIVLFTFIETYVVKYITGKPTFFVWESLDTKIVYKLNRTLWFGFGLYMGLIEHLKSTFIKFNKLLLLLLLL